MDQSHIAEALMTLIPLWMSLTVHEWAHAWSAYRLGDDTAAMLGRMTLNPLAHIDPVGTLLLPLLGVPFGWAKPVPVQPHRFRPGLNMRTGMMITAIAGPLSNLCLAAICCVALAVAVHLHPEALLAGRSAAMLLLVRLILLNVLLAAFNLLPIPPLDGSRVADALMPRFLRPAWEGFYRLGPIALAAVILLPRMGNVNLFAWPMQATFRLIEMILRVAVR